MVTENMVRRQTYLYKGLAVLSHTASVLYWLAVFKVSFFLCVNSNFYQGVIDF